LAILNVFREDRSIKGAITIVYRVSCAILLLACFVNLEQAFAQAPQVADGSKQQDILTLAQAEQLALQHDPRIASSRLLAQAGSKVVTEAQSSYFPTIYGSLTATAADHATVLAAGALQTSSLSSRTAAGIGLLQLVTDFGRTSSLVQAARFREAAETQNAADARARVLLEVRNSYYQGLATEEVEKVARAALDNRRLTLRQVNALAQSQMKSTLDVTVVEVLVSEAELAVFQAENNVQEARTQLAAAMGDEQELTSALVDEALPPPLDSNADSFIAQALQNRPDLQALQLNQNASHQFAESEKKLSYPSVNLIGVAGEIPEYDSTIHRDNYAAIGMNINIPIFNGRLFTSRHAEAELRSQAADKDVEEMKIRVIRDTRTAWLEANNAFRRLDVTGRLVGEANQELHLAQARYDNGLGSIVELNQAQLSQMSAEIEAASAKYDYLARRAALDYATGTLR
jgi:outer membrane protein